MNIAIRQSAERMMIRRLEEHKKKNAKNKEKKNVKSEKTA